MKYYEDKNIFKNLNDYTSDFASQNKKRTGPNPASFTCVNNSFCVTSFNSIQTVHGDSIVQTSLVIFDMERGEVVHRITQMSTSVNMMTHTLSISLHPRYQKVCVTCDTDGQIIFWDCALGTVLRVFVEHAAHIGLPLESNAVSECNFSKCGNFLVIGTSYGSFSVYGYGGSDLYEHVDVEQFTSTDYNQTMIAPDTYQILNQDSGRIMGEEEDEGFPCNFNLTPRQRIVNSMRYEEARAWLDEKANSMKYRLTELKKVDESSQNDLKEVVLAERRKGMLQKKIFSEKYSAEPSSTNFVGRDLLQQVQEIAGAQMTSSSAGILPNNNHQTNPAPAQYQAESSESRSRSPQQGRGGRLIRKRLISESSMSVPSQSDEEFEDSEERNPKRRSQRIRKLKRTTTGMTLRNRAGDNMGKRDTVEDDDDSDEFYKGFKKIKRVEKAKETPIIEEELFCTRCNKVGAREKCEGKDESCQNIYHVNCSDLCGADFREKFLCFDCLLDFYQTYPTNFDYSKYELDDMWLDIQTKDVDMMAPQIGDKYYFVFQAYESFVSKFFDLLNFKCGDVFWPWRQFPILQEKEVKCEVVSIEYEFPKLRGKKVQNEMKNYLTIIMAIKLRIVEREEESMMEDEEKIFEVKYFPVNDMPSFLVWHSTYEKRVREYIQVPHYSEIKYGNEFYNIKEKSYLEDSFPRTLYHSIKARPVLDGVSTRRREQNDGDGMVLFSPWEVEYQHVIQKSSRRSEEPPSASLQEDQSPPGIPPFAEARLTDFMNTHARHCPAFIYEVDKKVYPEYTEVVKVEMYLMKIYNRCQNGYYRSLASLVHDISLLRVNACLFNDTNSSISKQSMVLSQYLSHILSDEGVNVRSRECEKMVRQLCGMGLGEVEVVLGERKGAGGGGRREGNREKARRMNNRGWGEKEESSGRSAGRSTGREREREKRSDGQGGENMMRLRMRTRQ